VFRNEACGDDQSTIRFDTRWLGKRGAARGACGDVDETVLGVSMATVWRCDDKGGDGCNALARMCVDVGSDSILGFMKKMHAGQTGKKARRREKETGSSRAPWHPSPAWLEHTELSIREDGDSPDSVARRGDAWCGWLYTAAASRAKLHMQAICQKS
jgi:hypothetical protein